MAILVNMGKRGFILKEGFLKPGDQITVSKETAEKLAKFYPGEIKVVVADEPKQDKKAEPEETPVENTEVKEEKPTVEPEVKEETPVKNGGRKKGGKNK